MQGNNDVKLLKIPENVPLRWELFRGFGLSELLRSLGIIAIAGGGAFVYTQLSASPFRILTAIVILVAAGIVSVGLFAKQANNLSMYDYIKYMVQFGKTQKQYDNMLLEEFVELR